MEQTIINLKSLKMIPIPNESGELNEEENNKCKLKEPSSIRNKIVLGTCLNYLNNNENSDFTNINNNNNLNQESKSSISKNTPSYMNTITSSMHNRNKFKKNEAKKFLASLSHITNCTPSIKNTNLNTAESGNNYIEKKQMKSNHLIKSFRKDKHHRKNLSIDTNNNYYSSLDTPKCSLCKRFYSAKNTLNTGSCSHVYCFKCIQQVFEKNIEQGNTNLSTFKCPIVLCEKLFRCEIVFQVLSPAYLAYITGQEYFLKSSFDEVKALREKSKEKDNVVLNVYNQHNVIDLSTNRNFYSYTKFKQKICPYCHCVDLFNKKASVFFVCLNCLKSFCKYCKLEYNETHLMQNNIEHCRVCFRNGYNELKQTFCKKILNVVHHFLYVILAYFIIHIGLFSIIDSCYYNKSKWKKLKWLIRALSVSCSILSYILLLPLVLLIIPYFPLIMIL